MSLTEVIFSQQAVVLSLLAAGLILLAAVGLVVGVAVRGALAKTAARRAKAAELAQSAAQAGPLPDPERRIESPASRINPAASTPGGPASATYGSAPENPTGKAATSAATAPATASSPAAKPATPATPAPEPSNDTPENSAMKDLFASVFSDEDRAERLGRLLSGVGEIDIEQLKTLSEDVAAHLRAQRTAIAQPDKR